MTGEQLMRRALDLAGRARYSVSPNPMVGCVIEREGRVIGEGFHLRTGEPHAEVEALRSASESVAGATVYVTLEPCSHHGRTPPCVDALIEARVARVVVATLDPSPNVNGAGVTRLCDAGIEVETGLLAAEAERLNERFLFSARTSRPFVLLKAGMTLDGKLATETRRSRWITSDESRQRSLMLREEHEAILVGAGTIAADDPQLTRRLGLASSITPWTRVVVDTRGGLPSSARVLSDGSMTLLFTVKPDGYWGATGLEIVPIERASLEQTLHQVIAALGERGIRSVIAEGGSRIHTALIRGALWQKMVLFVAPMLLGGADAPGLFGGPGTRELTGAMRLRFDAVERIGPDVTITAYPA